MVSTARRAAEDLLGECRGIRLNAEESRKLVGALLAPPKPPTKKFLKGLELYRESVVSDVNPLYIVLAVLEPLKSAIFCA